MVPPVPMPEQTGAEPVDRAADLLKYLLSGGGLLCDDVVDVYELLRDKHAAVLLLYSHCGRKALVDALSDVAVVVDEQDLGAVMLHKLAAFFAYGIRHYDDGAVTADSAYKS